MSVTRKVTYVSKAVTQSAVASCRAEFAQAKHASAKVAQTNE